MTRDGGISWADITAPTSFSLAASFFIDADTGWVAWHNGAILVTVSGGRQGKTSRYWPHANPAAHQHLHAVCAAVGGLTSARQ